MEPHERSPNAPKFEDRSREETEWQELGAREAAWKLAKNVFNLKEHEKAAFFSSPENRCHLASSLKPVEGLYPTPHIHEQMTAYIMGYVNSNLEHNTMINIDTVAHMNMHYTQY